ncbi:hypothetical protein [Maridesulfovibrio sp.]|uniref:hypothetical protein n=1 Tax=Maridesulfovibrio sp. TaxID=2795000 RepID=UPI0029C9C8EF|nr:hypothetical protein [Maridesulfovibrio sp.]
MGEIVHKIKEQSGVHIHRFQPGKRSHEDFDVSKMSSTTRASFCRVCRDGGATPEDYRHVFESVLGSAVVLAVLGEEGS